MILSLAIILIFGILAKLLFRLLKLPGLLGMLFVGIVLGPYALNLIDSSILDISQDLRTIALIIILLRAGLELDRKDIQAVGRPAFLLSFLPATFEILAVTLLAPLFFDFTYLEAAILGSILAAVSPAVLVPSMLDMIHNHIGTKKKIPHMMIAGASVDDVLVIVIFTTLTGAYFGQSNILLSVLSVPLAIGLGIITGLVIGFILSVFFKKVHMRDSIKVVIIVGIAMFLVGIEHYLVFAFSALLAVMSIGLGINQFRNVVAKRLSLKFNRLWVFAELLLFVLVGATVDLSVLGKIGLLAIALVFGALIMRSIAVFIATSNASLTPKEQLFCAVSYLPKATVQAAIGAIPLSMGIRNGEIMLAIAVLAIILTAPLGAIGINYGQKRWLEPNV